MKKVVNNAKDLRDFVKRRNKRMNELLIKIFIKLFVLIEGRLSQNICKVFAVATIVGVFFSALCVDGPYTGRAVFFGFVCLLMACFFGSMALMYEEVYAD